MLTRCPHCFTQLPEDRYAFRCVGACSEEEDRELSISRGSEERHKPVFHVPPVPGTHRDTADCLQCSVTSDAEVCPTCHYGLLRGWRWATTTCVAMAGARASGKSIYIGVLVKQAQLWCERYGHALVAPDPRTDEQYTRVYETPLFERRGLIPPTPTAAARLSPQREPLVFDMGQFEGPQGLRHHMLVLRDVAGEDLESPATAPGPFRFFGNADVIAFLFDPMRLPEVRGQLDGTVDTQQLQGGDPVEVLRNLIRLMRGGSSFGPALTTPLALVVGKFDTLAELADVEGGPMAPVMGNPGATFNLDPSLEPVFLRDDADRLQAELESLLVRLNARSLLNLVDASFEHRRLFAVSALGALPADSESVSARGIAPFRVLDPLKWALSRTGLIPES
ncbi:MAG: hypothetical protein JWO60_1444 [Frankiales bacterium]|nr:hypothetical protein [Frankiales bacterium]